MTEAALTQGSRKALALIRASGHVIVDADLPVHDLVTLAGAATDIWVFQIAGNLTIAAAKSVICSSRWRM